MASRTVTSIRPGYCQEVLRLVKSLDDADLQALGRWLLAVPGTVYTAGNGGSAANAAHLACHLVDVGLRAVCLTDNAPLFTARANDYAYEDGLRRCVPRRSNEDDAIVALSCSGRSPNILRLLQYARGRKMRTAVLFGSGASWPADFTLSLDSVSAPAVEDTHSVIIHAIKEMLTAEP